MLTAADAETVAEVACVEHDEDEADEDADEAEREHREPAGGVDHVAHGGVDDVEHKGDGEQQCGRLIGGDGAAAQQRAGLGFDLAEIERNGHKELLSFRGRKSR